jgi:hypothetical protein
MMKALLILSYVLGSILPINNDWEFYQKRVNEIYLNSKIDSFPISSVDSIELNNIAYLHSSFYGPGVFSARAILKLEVEDLDNGTTRSSFVIEEENVVSKNFEIYPNPNNGNFIIQLNEEYICNEIEITDISGKVIYTLKNSDNKIELNLEVSNGIYLINLKYPDGKIESDKLIISK